MPHPHRSLPLAAALISAAVTPGCPDDPPDATVTVAGDAVFAEVDPRFLSFAVDTAQVLGGVFWNPDPDGPAEIEVEPFDFGDPALRSRTEALIPAVLRVGGTAADFVFADYGDDPVDEPPAPYQLVLTPGDWDRFADFADDLGLSLLFTLSAGPGPRDADGAWDAETARPVIEHAADRGDDVVLWELGNEINGYLLFHGLSLTPAQYADDLAAARALLDEADPDGRLGGPSSAYWPVAGDLTGFYPELMPVGGDRLDVITWHYYPQQSSRCPVATRAAGPEVMLDPANLDEVLTWSDEIEGLRDAHAPGTEVWLSETGNAQCGGEPGVSDAWAGSLWWLDQLGALARRGQPIVVRQTLAGSDYGLLDDVTFEPYPDYWVSALHKALLGPRVLDAASDAGDSLRVYAHCLADGNDGAEDGGVAFALVHVGDDPLALALDVDGPIDVYRLTAPALDSRDVSLEGTLLGAEDRDGLRALGERSRRPRLTIEGRSLAFAVAPEADLPACR